jgi:hypothetical protein
MGLSSLKKVVLGIASEIKKAPLLDAFRLFQIKGH